LGYADGVALTAEQSTRLDLATALRMSLDAEQAKLLRGEPVAPSKLLDIAEALGRLVPPLARPPTPASREGGPEDPRQRMWETYSAMRGRGELFERAQEPTLRARIAELEAEVALLKGGAPAEPSPPAALPPNVLSTGAHAKRTSGHACACSACMGGLAGRWWL
jgi:hypothetical protein